MSIYRQTETGDLYRPPDATTFERVGGIDEIVQCLRTRLRLFTAEVFRDLRIGVQYFELCMRPGIAPTAIANHIAAVALATPGIIDVELTFEVEPIRGIVTIEADGLASIDDLRERVPFHEVIQVQTGGSIQL